MRPSPFRGSIARVLARALALIAVLSAGVTLWAQIPGRNVNMVAGTEWPGGDPFLQRQNEPSIAASTRNPLHLVAGSNDYRTVDLPGLPDGVETGDAWVSVYKSFDGGARWSSTLMPGYPQDTSAAGLASPIKGYQAAADPVVRAGTNGLLYYNGLVFDRGDNGKSGIFLARFIDRNNKENGDPISYLGASMVASSNGTVFLDKPWMAVDLARDNAPFCVVGGVATGARVKRAGHRLRGNSGQVGGSSFVWVDPGLQYVPAGAIYVAYTSITGDATAVPSTLRSEILLKRSLDCGATWSAPLRVSRSTDAINQGATISIDPARGDVFVAYRRFATPEAPTADAVMVARLPVGQMAFGPAGMARALPRTDSPTAALERIFEHRKRRAQTTPAPAASTTAQIDQGTSPYSFRTNAYPTMTIDGTSRVYVAWSERGFGGARSSATDGDARIRVATTVDAATFSAPVTVEDPTETTTGPPLPGHQLMPSLAFSGGKLLLVYYDLRETRANVFGPFVSDQGLTTKRQTIDIRASLGTPGAAPTFAPSVRVSDYLMGFRGRKTSLEQLQVNPPNLPMFKQGTVPFIGDYIDVAPSPAFVPTATGGWAFNTASTGQIPLFHAVWTDNRDVRPPLDGNWRNYTPPTITGVNPGTSIFDPTQTVAVCRAGNAGTRNQNIYTARIGGGLLAGSPGNTKPLSPTVQRGFVVFAQNQTTTTRTFRMSILAQPVGGRASFEQFPRPPYAVNPPPPPPVTTIDVRVPPRSTASRTVYATSTDPKAQINVNVSEVAVVGGAPVPGGLADRVVLNPDIENPDIENPDIENPDIENPNIANAEVYNPDIENPDIENPDIENQGILNPDIENPDIENVTVANPDIENIGIATPDIENPDIENPDIENGTIATPDIENGTISDVTWTVSNIGNTTSAFNVNVFLAAAGVPSGINTQLIVYKTYKTPVLAPNGCDLRTETRNVVLFNRPNPNFITPGEGLPDQNDPSDTNATLWLNPGEVGRVTLRVYDYDKSDNVTYTNPDGTTASIDPRFNPATVTTVGISGQGVDVLDPPGATEPPAVTTTGTNLFFLQQPTNTAPGAIINNVIESPVQVRVWDNTGAPLPGVPVTIVLCGPPNPLQPANPCPAPPAGVVLSGTTTVNATPLGIASFGDLRVNLQASGLRLRATAAAAGVVAAGTSAPFNLLSVTPSFVQQPSAVNVGASITPAVSVSVNDSTGAVVPGVQVSLTLLSAAGGPLPGGVVLSGATPALTNAAGIATFAGLSVNQVGTYVLRATATVPGAVGVTTSAPFNVGALSIPTTLSITNWARIFNGNAQGVTVSSVPVGATVAVTYNGSPTVPSAIGAYTVVATPTAPYAGPAVSVNMTIASTLSGGGPGGGPYARSCSGGFATGFSTNNFSTYGLLNAQLECETGGPTQRFVLNNNNFMNQASTCGLNQVMVGFHGLASLSDVTAGPFVKSLGARCQDRSGAGAISTIPAVGIGGDPFGPFDCPAGQAVTGVVGGAGSVLDSVALVCSAIPPPAPSGTITSVSPSSGASNEGFLVVRGAGLPAVAGSIAVVTSGATTGNGFIFLSPSTPSAYWVRLPVGFPTGPATIRIQNGALLSNAFPITVSAVPGIPVVTGVRLPAFPAYAFTSTVTPGTAVLIAADGMDTLGWEVRFTQGASTWSVTPDGSNFAVSNETFGLAAYVVVPAGPVAGPIVVSMRQGASAFSAPVTLTVVP